TAEVTISAGARALGSPNGTRITGVRVKEGPLKNGDELTTGNTRFEVRGDEAAPPFVGSRHDPHEPALPAPRVELPDELLESCEDPVALADEDEKPLPRARPAGPAPPKLSAHQPADPPSPVAPGQLQLAPIT